MIKIKIEACDLSDYFDQYSQNGFWYIVPKESFAENMKYLTEYYDGVEGTDYIDHIFSSKLPGDTDESCSLDSSILEYFIFEFPDEETALYFKLKYCSD